MARSLPRARGPLSGSVLDALRWGSLHRAMDGWRRPDEPLADPDLHLALLCLHRWPAEAAVDDPSALVALRATLEDAFLQAVRSVDAEDALGVDIDGDIVDVLRRTAAAWTGSPSPERYLVGFADGTLARELAVHRQIDGPSLPAAAALDLVPGVTLARANLASLFAQGAGWTGARLGHAAVARTDRTGLDLAALRAANRDEVLFGARVALAADERLNGHIVRAWRAGRSSLAGPVHTAVAVEARNVRSA